MAKFEIGDTVKIRETGIAGIIKDCFITEKSSTCYLVENGDGENFYHETALEPIRQADDSTFTVDLKFEDGAAIATLYKKHPNGRVQALKHTHGHIMHDGVLGIVQAASYALKKMYYNVEEEEKYNG